MHSFNLFIILHRKEPEIERVHYVCIVFGSPSYLTDGSDILNILFNTHLLLYSVKFAKYLTKNR